jgi:CheY-like chemotaxis protein
MTASTILVVDDSRSARFAMRRFLENLGHAVATAESAEEALEYLKGNQPAAAFLDHIMPGIDGLTALGLIRQNPHTAQLPVVLCSSNETADFRGEARSLGAVDVLPKPPATEQLRAVLERVQRWREENAAAAPMDKPPVALRIEAPAPHTAATPPVEAAAAPSPPPPPAAELAPGALLHVQLHDAADDLSAQLEALRARLLQQETAAAQAAAAAERRLAQLAQAMERRFIELRTQLDDGLRRQERRIEEIGAGLRQALTEESGAAGARIAEQLADALVRGLRSS